MSSSTETASQMTTTLLGLLVELKAEGDVVKLGQMRASSSSPEVLRYLLRFRVLQERPPPNCWAPCDGCECDALFRSVRISANQHEAVCPFRTSRTIQLTEDQLRSFRIGAQELAQVVAYAAGFEAVPSQVTEGLWLLGELTNGERVERYVFLTFGRTTVTHDGFVSLVKETVGNTATTLLGPPLPPETARTLARSGVHHAVLAQLLDPDDSLVGARILRRQLQPEVKRLVMSRRGHLVWVDGQRQRVADAPFRLLLMLAEAVINDSVLLAEEVERAFSQREAKKVVADLRPYLKGRDGGEILIECSRSPTTYELKLLPGDIELLE